MNWVDWLILAWTIKTLFCWRLAYLGIMAIKNPNWVEGMEINRMSYEEIFQLLCAAFLFPIGGGL